LLLFLFQPRCHNLFSKMLVQPCFNKLRASSLVERQEDEWEVSLLVLTCSICPRGSISVLPVCEQSTGKKESMCCRDMGSALKVVCRPCPVMQNDTVFPEILVVSIQKPVTHFFFHQQNHVDKVEFLE
jgi:hypothetical protein